MNQTLTEVSTIHPLAYIVLFLAVIFIIAFGTITIRNMKKAEIIANTEPESDQTETSKTPEARPAATRRSRPIPRNYSTPPRNKPVSRTEVDDDDDFLDSAIIAGVTDSPVLGAALGGSVGGAILGSMVGGSDDDDDYSSPSRPDYHDNSFDSHRSYDNNSSSDSYSSGSSSSDSSNDSSSGSDD